MSKDFFDEEFEKMEEQKKEQEEQSQAESHSRQNDFDAWFNYDATEHNSDKGNGGGGSGNGAGSVRSKSARPWFIALLCVMLAVAIAFGWVMCAVFGGNGGTTVTQNADEQYIETVVNSVVDVLNESRGHNDQLVVTDEQLQQIVSDVTGNVSDDDLTYQALLAEVFSYLRQNYYKDISDDQWETAVAAAGTALMESAGDQYCQLMSPQSYYNFTHAVSTTQSLSGNGTYFGITYTFSSGLGLYVSGVLADSSCYGLLEEDDIILKLTDIEYDQDVVDTYTAQVEDYSVDTSRTEIVVSEMTNQTFSYYMVAITKANFRYLRDGDAHDTGVIVRGGVGIENSAYDYNFVEFYFGDDCTNVSTSNQYEAQHNTKELRNLDQLPSDTGYIRINEFMNYYGSNGYVYAYDEFYEVMQLFKQKGLKRLVLDLKGNPGGYVSTVCDIAGMLISDENLTSSQKSTVTNGSRLLVTSLVPKNDATENYYRASTYSTYFGEKINGKCNIVIWTDSGSASASELLTGALTDYGTGFQIGAKTYGKGIAQTYEALPYVGTITTLSGATATYNWAIYYTYAAYYSPLGNNIHGTGYTPSDGYGDITDYADLWAATLNYWNN